MATAKEFKYKNKEDVLGSVQISINANLDLLRREISAKLGGLVMVAGSRKKFVRHNFVLLFFNLF